MLSTQNRQTFLLARFCQPFSSFSRLTRFFVLLPAIQWCLLVRSAYPDGYGVGLPVTASSTALLLHLRRGPPQARPELVRLDLRHGSLVALLRLPRPGLQPPDHDHAAPPGQRFGRVLGKASPR